MKSDTIAKKKGRYFLASSSSLSLYLPFPLFLSFLNNLLIQYDKEYLKENKNSSDNKIAECIFIIPHVKMAD